MGIESMFFILPWHGSLGSQPAAFCLTAFFFFKNSAVFKVWSKGPWEPPPGPFKDVHKIICPFLLSFSHEYRV